MSKFIIFLLFISSPALIYSQQKKLTPFSVTITVNNGDVASAKAKAQLEMARNKTFCRGFMIPRPKNKWVCTDYDGERVQCVRNYLCKYASRFTNRKTESIKEWRVVKNSPAIVGPFKMNLLGREINFDPKTQEKLPEKTVAKVEAVNDLVEVEALNEEELDNQSVNAEKELAKLESQDEFFDETTDNKDDEFVVKDSESNKKSSEKIKNEWFNFLFTIDQYSDDFEDMMTFDFAYTPRIYLYKGAYIGGNLGFHQLTTNVDTAAEESFWVTDTGIVLGYQMERGFYFGYALGKQGFGNEAGDSFNYGGFLGGYRFAKKKLKYIDSLHVQMNSLDTLVNSKELKIGIGASF